MTSRPSTPGTSPECAAPAHSTSRSMTCSFPPIVPFRSSASSTEPGGSPSATTPPCTRRRSCRSSHWPPACRASAQRASARAAFAEQVKAKIEATGVVKGEGNFGLIAEASLSIDAAELLMRDMLAGLMAGRADAAVEERSAWITKVSHATFMCRDATNADRVAHRCQRGDARQPDSAVRSRHQHRSEPRHLRARVALRRSRPSAVRTTDHESARLMTSILWVEGSPKGERSLSSSCARAFLDALGDDVSVTHVDVWSDEALSFGREAALAKFAPIFGEARTPEQEEIWEQVSAQIDQVARHDALLISSPMWNWSIPHALKAWIDVVVQPFQSFTLDAAGRHVGTLGVGKRAQMILTRSVGLRRAQPRDAGSPGAIPALPGRTPRLRPRRVGRRRADDCMDARGSSGHRSRRPRAITRRGTRVPVAGCEPQDRTGSGPVREARCEISSHVPSGALTNEMQAVSPRRTG